MTNYLFAVQETISRYGRYLCLYATILFYVLSNQTFQPGELYMIVGLLHAISLHALMFLSHAVQHIVRAAVSINRIKVKSLYFKIFICVRLLKVLEVLTHHLILLQIALLTGT